MLKFIGYRIFLSKNSIIPVNYRTARPRLYCNQRNISSKIEPQHLICLKEWDAKYINTIIRMALNLKCLLQDSHGIMLITNTVFYIPTDLEKLDVCIFHIVRPSRILYDCETQSCLQSFYKWVLVNISTDVVNDCILSVTDIFICTNGSKKDRMIRKNVLPYNKVMILEDHNEPILRMAASKATSLLGANDVHIVNKIQWDQHYYGAIFSEMADIILVSTETDGCIRRFIKQSSVPVVCMRTRKHASIQSMATIMSIIEEYGTMKSLNIAYVGSPHQVLNDYLILCPLLGANLNFKCCCSTCPVSPLLFQDCKDMCKKLDTTVGQFTDTSKALEKVAVLIAGPTTRDEKKLTDFTLCSKEIERLTNCNWTFYHTCPRGKEVDDDLFWHPNTRTYNAFRNMQYITAALMIFSMKHSTEKQCDSSR